MRQFFCVTLRGCGWPFYVVVTALAVSLFVAAAYLWEFFGYFRDAHFISGEGHYIGRDFANIWLGGKAVLAGRVQELFDLDAYKRFQSGYFGFPVVLNWSYPPFLLPFIAGFGFLPYLSAFALWMVLTFAAYAFAVTYRRPSPWALSAVLFFAPSSFENVVGGQNGFLSAALLVGGLRLLERRPVLAGVLFGFLTFKPHLGLLLPFALIAARKWRTIASALVMTCLLVAASLFAFGAEPWMSYFRVTMPFQNALLEADPLLYYQAMMPTPFMALRLAGAPLTFAYAVTAIFALAVAFSTYFVFERSRADDLRLNVLLAGALLATPYAFSYDMTIVSAAVVSSLCLARARPFSAFDFALLLVVWLLPMEVFSLGSARFPLPSLVLLVFFILQIWPFISDRLLSLKANRAHA